MARETSYFVQAFNPGKGGNLKADAPIPCKSATGALRTAEQRSHPRVIPRWATMTTSPPSSSATAGFPRPSTEIPNAKEPI